MTSDDLIPRALELLWHGPAPTRRTTGLNRHRIVAAAIELADADGLAALSMARLAERLGCGTMSLYRHVANKDELLTFMVSTAPGPPPTPSTEAGWRDALSGWATGLWDLYHRHPWMLQTASAGPPVDPGQLAWLDAGLATFGGTGLSEAEKMSAVLAVLHFARGAAAVDVDGGTMDRGRYSAILKRFVDPDHLPALAAALDTGVFDGVSDPLTKFWSGLDQLLDGVAAKVAAHAC